MTAALLFAAGIVGSAGGADGTNVDAALQARVEAIGVSTGGVLGVAAHDLGTGRSIGVRVDERFPMASTYKLPIAVAVMDRIQRGALAADRPIPIRANDLRLGVSAIAEEWNPGMSRSVDSLMRSMLVESDNTASDLLMGLAGGPAAVTARLRGLSIVAMDVNRTELQIGADFSGASLPASGAFTLETLAELVRGQDEATKTAAAKRFAADKRDTTTPRAMTQLIDRLAKGDVAGSQQILTTMAASTTGPNRLRAGLPKGTGLSHKTGTCLEFASINCTNDVGLIPVASRPGGGIAIAVFLKNAKVAGAKREAAIADVARAVYDAWGR